MGRTIRKSQNLKLALRSDSGLNIGMVYPLSNKRNVLGRSVDAEVPVEDSKVSRNHASIDVQNGFYYLVDLGSTNGSFLNGKKIEHSKRINLGDRIRLGSAVYVVELLDQAKASLSKNWRESTRIVSSLGSEQMTEPEFEEQEEAAPQKMPVKWSLKKPWKWAQKNTAIFYKHMGSKKSHLRIVVLALAGVSVVVAAIWF